MLVQQSKSSLSNSRKQHRDSYVEQFQLTQHQFQTEREQATNTSLNNNPTAISLGQSSSTELLLSNFTIEFHINNPIREILYQFKTMLNEKGYKCIEIFENQLYIVRMFLKDKLRKLFACIEPPKYLLHIRTHEFRSVRTVTIKPLQADSGEGSYESITTRSTPASLHQASDLLDFLSTSTKLNKPLTNEQLNELDCEYKQDIYSLDATANFMFSRMLVDTNYTIGKRIAQVVNQFRDNKRCIEELKFVQLLWMNKAISEVTQEMLQGFNCSRKELYEILGYCRKSIESYFYRCIEQNQIEMATEKQRKKLQQNIPQKDNSKHSLSGSSQLSHARRQHQLLESYPVSMKHLRILNGAVISIQIYQQLFSLSEFVKIETQGNNLGEDKKGEFLQWVRERYGERILQKLKALRAAGFGERCFESFIKELKLQE